MSASARPVHSWDEFSTLREVVVGSALGARLPAQTDPSAWLSCYPSTPAGELAAIPVGPYEARVVEETEEDLAVLAETLTELGVTVRRPEPIDHAAEFATPLWRAEGGFHSYCPRDLSLVVGETVIEVASPMRARYFEVFGLRPLFQEYLAGGARWLCAPRPRLADELFEYDAEGLPLLGESEPVFDAANVLRLGRDVFYQVSRSGNELGLRWLESTLGLLGDLRLHPLRGIYGYTHIDSTIALLRPGLVLLNPERISPDRVPAALRGWDVLWCPPAEVPVGPADAPVHALSESWISMNLLMVSPELAIVESGQPALVKMLEHAGITVMPHRLRHSRVLGGGFHCVTLDIRRDGGLEDYLG
ncbi:scyllo-inosamine-4-phosphate amidinotransferase [Kitasatospora sp. MMS16-BH015]|uniref:scyllo-inosamine-4-phosphate amidinotransferase n=1 Tax=Kitasatospora sp. MMS16-BH015 TaxID=2018025 RepID=UPI000CA26078|nr:scyllo-inosamine-4-phosphate amidinotransferase [Kitasatospora sp. MMS16-BH015]AUG80588.1 scyllo-inosamine-4-phosphate amidinotransferase [Kitasatospora sp. MMS16-BH015]